MQGLAGCISSTIARAILHVIIALVDLYVCFMWLLVVQSLGTWRLGHEGSCTLKAALDLCFKLLQVNRMAGKMFDSTTIRLSSIQTVVQ